VSFVRGSAYFATLELKLSCAVHFPPQIVGPEMKRNRSWRFLLAQIVVFSFFTLGIVKAQGTPAGNGSFRVATDWSHRHLVFSPPKSLIDRFRFSSDVRYIQQWVRRNAEEKRDEERERERERDHERRHRREPNTLQEDWNVYAGNVGTVGADRFPAKFSFDVTTANCGTATQADFVAWNTSLAGSSSPVAAEDIGTFTNTAGFFSNITITNGGLTLTMTALGFLGNFGAGNGTFNEGGSGTASASGLAAGINLAGNGSYVGVSATSSGATVTITATTAGTSGNSITVTAGSGSNLTWTFPNFVDGATGVASVVAYDNLYSSCTGTVPSPYWAYNTGGTISNSVALSLDGKQVAFVQSQAGTASLVILKWAASSGAVNTPVNLTTQTSAAAYRSCIAPCMYTIAFNGGRNDSNSSPYYDSDTDTFYVGDDPTTRGTTHSTLHKFTGVFNGNPAEVLTGGWPVTLGTEILTSPVYDGTNGQVYVADSNSSSTTPTGGFLYRVDGTAGTVVTSTRLAEGGGFVEGPVVDPVNGTVYLYSSAGGTIGCPSGSSVNSVYQMAVGFTAGQGSMTSAQVSTTGTCSSTLPLYAGDFDNAYYSGGAGNLYVCGNIGGNPTLYQVSVSSTGGLGTVTTGPNIASATAGCSPLTEFYNANATGGAKDWIFLNTQASAVTASPINCPAASGCIMSFDVTSGLAISTSTATTARANVAGGASGLVIDNSATAAGESEVYFTPLATGTCTTTSAQGIGGCAIQASQAGLM